MKHFKTLALFFLFLIAFTSCKDDGGKAELLIGKWIITDFEILGNNQLTEEEKAQVNEFMRDGYYDIKDDGTCELYMGIFTQKGSWKLINDGKTFSTTVKDKTQEAIIHELSTHKLILESEDKEKNLHGKVTLERK